MPLSNWFAQVASITRFALQTIPERKGASAAAVFGIAGVVAVMIGVLSIAQGFRHALTIAGDPGVALVLRSGSDTEMMSILSREETRVISDSSWIAPSPNGPLASSELFVIINLPKRTTGTDANVPLRGVGPAAFSVRDDIRIVEGRHFESGRNEVIAGLAASGQFAGLELGSSLQIGPNEWRVVGLFSANGGLAESEVWTDARMLQAAYQRGTSFQSVYAKLLDPGSFDRFEAGLASDPRLNVKVIRQTDYYAEQSVLIYNLITRLGALVAALMGLGATFGALNTMYTAVSARTREIATLRALGFGSSPVIVSILIEALFLALLGGVIGGAFAYFAFDGYRAATINWQSFSQVAFAFAVTPGLLAKGILYAALIGFIGGLFPAIRAARLPVALALRET